MQIGPNGRLGNQMFQYAALVGVSKIKKFKWALHQNEKIELRDVFKLPNALELKEEQKSMLQYQ